MAATCKYSVLVGGVCGPNIENPADVECVAIAHCQKDVHSHLRYLKISDDSAVFSEAGLLLARGGVFDIQEKHMEITICPRHRSSFGIRWRCGKTNCSLPSTVSAHPGVTAKAYHGLKAVLSDYILRTAGTLIQVGSPICKKCKENLEKLVKEVDAAKPLSQEERSASSDELAEGVARLTVRDKSYLLSPDCDSSSSSSGDGTFDTTQQRNTLNLFLRQCDILPLGRPWLKWVEVKQDTRSRFVARSGEIVSAVLKVVSPVNAQQIWAALQTSNVVNEQLGIGKPYHPSEVAYLEALAESYSIANSWDTRRQVLSAMTGIASFEALAQFIPGLTYWRYNMANKHRLEHGRIAPVPTEMAPRMRIDPKQLDHFLTFITSPHMVQDLPFGEKILKLSSGKVLSVPNVIRTMIPERIVAQYANYCKEVGFKPFSRSTMIRVLCECSASVRRSLQGLDYVAADGARAFDDLASIVQEVALLRPDGISWGAVIQDSLKAGKLYLKGDYKVHLDNQSSVAEHCIVFSLSDTSVAGFKEQCNHHHNNVCGQCEGLNVVIEKVGQAVRDAVFRSEDERDEALYIYESSKRAIKAWKAHQLRSVRQDQARLDIMDKLDAHKVLIIMDWAMKFIPQLFRETQQDWFGKRGISWHISVVYRRVGDDLQSQTFIHLIQSCNQDSSAVVLIMEHVLRTLKSEHPEIDTAFFRQDNAGCYHCSNTILAGPAIEKSSGVKIARIDFSDPQGGKGAADRKAANSKSHIRIYINSGHDVTTASQMKDALLSDGGVTGVRVAVLPTVGDVAEQTKLPGISKLNNFEFRDGSIVSWRAYNVGFGKTVVTNPADVSYSWLSASFSEGDFTSVDKRIRQKRPESACEASNNFNLPEQQSAANTKDLYACPREGCIRYFQTSSALEYHLSIEACELKPERLTLMDMAKEQYASRIEEGVGRVPSLVVTDFDTSSSQESTAKQGWALKEMKKQYRFNDSQKAYLEAKFNVGQATGRKLDGEVVAKEMRRARDKNGNRLFNVSEFLSPHQVSSYFSRLASKLRQQQVEVTDDDVRATEDEANFIATRASVLSTLQISHPIIVDQYNVCDIVNSKKLVGLKLGLLQVLSARLELNVPSPPKRLKEPYRVLLRGLVKNCSCNTE